MEAFNQSQCTALQSRLEPFQISAYVFCRLWFAGTIIGMLPVLGPISALALMTSDYLLHGPFLRTDLDGRGLLMGYFWRLLTRRFCLTPLVAGTVATSFDGYPIAKKGLAGKSAGESPPIRV